MKRPAACGKLVSILSETRICLGGNLHELERLAAEIAQFCEARGIRGEAEFQLNLVLEELFVNAIRHGGCEGKENAACVSLRAEPEGVQVEFSDRGQPFDLTAAPAADTTSPLSERRAGGLGIHLVRQIMRDISYHREGEWNVLTMQLGVEKQQETL